VIELNGGRFFWEGALMTQKGSLLAAGVGVASALLVGSASLARADQASLVPVTSITGPVLTFDWPAIEVGVGSYEEGPTGLTVIRFPRRASLVADSRGGAPGTVNTDALRLGYSSRFTDAVVFSGGASYGEEAITAVATALKDEGIRSGDWGNLAFVPGAVIYDFGGRRLNEIYPDKRLAWATLQAMRPGVFPLGAQGAGRMAMQGGFFGCDAHSGQGGAFRQVGSVKIAAFVVVNASGAVTDRSGRLESCHEAASWGSLTSTSELMKHVPASLGDGWVPPGTATGSEEPATRNTTVSLIVTNQKLSYAELQRLAIQVHTSMARAIQPFSTAGDGDTLFAASTQEVDSGDLNREALATVAGEVMWDAVSASVPGQDTLVPPNISPVVSADELSDYAGTYDFAVSPAQAVKPFSGLGLHVAIENGSPVVTPIVGGPAAAAGIEAGDVAIALDGSSLHGLSLGEVIDRMRGPTGVSATLTVMRKGEDQPIHIAVVREPVQMRPLLKVQVQNRALTVEAVGGEKVFEFESAKPTIVTPLSDTVFYVPARYHTRIEFTRDASGKVVGAILNPGRWEQRGIRSN
jgi:L-aminopeptidase/D-esterase-like protein